ncbi:MAG: sialidase family protein [Chloroflexota bacterium]
MKWERLFEAAPWGVRAMPRGGVMDGYFYVISGRTGPSKIYSDTWRSPDGISWELMSAEAGWGQRCYPEVDIIEGNLILTGGQDVNTFYNDVWRSSDCGRTWEQVNGNAPWGVRAGHHTTTIDDVIYLFGGGCNSWNRIFYPELWVSKDLGETWELRAELPVDMGRAGMQVVEIDGTIYFMGGDHDKPVFFPNWEGRRNDVWKSDDLGETWELLGQAPWVPRTGQQCIVHDGKVICIGGHAQGRYRFKQILMHDMWVWNPKDSVEDWKLVTNDVWGCETHPKRTGKSDFMLKVKDGKIWTLGGDREVLSPWPQDNDVWVANLPLDW